MFKTQVQLFDCTNFKVFYHNLNNLIIVSCMKYIYEMLGFFLLYTYNMLINVENV